MLDTIGKAAKQASYQLAQCSTKQKNDALNLIADLLESQSTVILFANQKDMLAAKDTGISEAILDRLLLTNDRLKSIANDVRQVSLLTDPVGEIIDGKVLPNGLKLQRHRVPLGVVAVIYEARPNVTIDVASLCLKTGNAVILRGGKETVHTNAAMVEVIQQALKQANIPAAAVQSINNTDRKYIDQLLKLDRYVDMLIPRGGPALQKLCKENATMPVIIGGIGICHTFVDESADFDKALVIIVNAKTQRPSTCNTTETLLVHRTIMDEFLPKLAQTMAKNNVTLHADNSSIGLLPNAKPLQLDDLTKEWLSRDLNVVVVDSLTQAVEHIRTHGSGHSEAILTRSLINAQQFIASVDAAAVYVNASTRFTDGGQFGLGAEVAVSTQKLHARGPMGLTELTTYKWIGFGDDLIRQ